MDWNIVLMVLAIVLSLPSVCVSIYTLADKLAEQRRLPNRRGKLMECTQQEFLDALKESGREGWTPRLMTSLREEGFLPPLKRQTQPETNKPLYVWEEDDFDQIAEAYDRWDYYEGNREPLAARVCSPTRSTARLLPTCDRDVAAAIDSWTNRTG